MTTWRNELLGTPFKDPQLDAAIFLWATYYVETEKYDESLSAEMCRDLRIPEAPRGPGGSVMLDGGWRRLSVMFAARMRRAMMDWSGALGCSETDMRRAKYHLERGRRDPGHKMLERIVADPPQLIRDARLDAELKALLAKTLVLELDHRG